ncbi:MAG: hypothetical protein HC906_19290 [Bacteroidales bacterium]|nr:hypothetical protein [Bacteroidales bacterium]
MKRIQLKNGFGVGDLNIRDTMPEGLYQIRAYTNWMKNFDNDYYFLKNIAISNTKFTEFISPADARKNQRIIKRTEKKADIDFQLFPEGGNLVEGIESIVAFKALDENGKPIDLNGTLVDSKKNEIVRFKSFYDGMGHFSFKPQKDEKYFVVYEFDKKSLKPLFRKH